VASLSPPLKEKAER